MTAIDPVRICCGRRMSEHDGPRCPDGLVMCCICFERFTPPEDTDWDPLDICPPCQGKESQHAAG